MTVLQTRGGRLPAVGLFLCLWSLCLVPLCLGVAGCSGDGETRIPARSRARRTAPAAGNAGLAAETPARGLMGEGEGDADAADSKGRMVKSPRNADEVLEDLAHSHAADLADAKHHAELGDAAYAEFDYAKAIDEYRLALDKNPALDDVRERWARASLVLGRRSGEVEAVKRELVETSEVKKDQRLADARQGIREAQDLLGSGELDLAERKFRKVYEELLWFEYPIDVTDLRREAKARLDEIDTRRREKQRDARKDQEELAHQENEKALDREKQVREQRVRELVRKAADYIRLKDHDKAIEACERIIEIKPDHRVAKFWLRDMKRQKMDMWKVQLHREKVENQLLTNENLQESAIPYTENFVFPAEADWAIARRRQSTTEIVDLDDPEWIRRIKNRMESDRLTFAFEQRPLKDVLQFLRDRTSITFLTDSEIKTEEINIDLTARDMKIVDVLNQVLIQAGLAYTFREGTVYITEKDKARGATTFAIYDVSDLLNKIRNFEGPQINLQSQDDQASSGTGGTGGSLAFEEGTAEDSGPIDATQLIELIKESSGGEAAWGELNTIEPHKGQLLVNATKELHAQLQSTLKSLREDSDLFVVLEARFIEVDEDFLEDVGVDSRALGEGSNFGTPFGNLINNSATGGNDLGFVKQGSPVRDVTLIMGLDRYAGRIQHIVDGFTGLVSGRTLSGGPGGTGGFTGQFTWLEPFQINVILRAVQEESNARQLTAPIITAHNGQRVYVSVITQRAYIADYELVSGGTGFTIIEVADPVIQTFQDGVILDVDPVISPDKKYITIDVRPTLASLIGGVISTIRISLGSFTNVAFQVPIGVPKVQLQESFTSVTVPNGGTVLIGGFKFMEDSVYKSYLPILGKIPLIKNLFRRKAKILEKESLIILITARIVDLRKDERTRYNE